MVKNAINDKSFLTPDQEAAVFRARTAYESLALQGSKDASMLSGVRSSIGLVGSMNGLLTELGRYDDEHYRDPKAELLFKLQVAARGFVTLDLVTGSVIRASAWLTGVEKAKGHDDAVGAGYELGHDTIAQRAKSTAAYLVGATATLVEVYPELDEDTPFWDFTIATHQRASKITPPVELYDEDMELLDGLRNRSFAHSEQIGDGKKVPKLSRSRIRNALKVAKSAPKAVKVGLSVNNPIDGLRSVKELAGIPEPVDFDQSEIIRGIRVVGNMLRYMGSASRLDSQIAADPRYRYVLYLHNNLKAYRQSDERNVYDNIVTRVSKKFASSHRLRTEAIEMVTDTSETRDEDQTS